jgi:hypothetical protein
MDVAEMGSAYYRAVLDEAFPIELIISLDAVLSSPNSHTWTEMSGILSEVKDSIVKVKGIANGISK